VTDRPSRDRLVFHALCVLDQAVRDCQYAGPLKLPQPGLRLALAYLFAVSTDQPDIHASPRDLFDRFWRAITGGDIGGPAELQARFRSTQARTEFAGICRRVGVVHDIAFGEALERAAAGKVWSEAQLARKSAD
jgi:hypothetical protein